MKTTLDIDLSLSHACKNALEAPLILPCDVHIRFFSNVYVIPTLSIHIKNGNFKRKITTTLGEEIDISDCFLKAGKVEISVAMIINGESVKEWIVEPIIIKEIEHSFIAIPEIEDLKSRLNIIENAIREIAKIITEKENF